LAMAPKKHREIAGLLQFHQRDTGADPVRKSRGNGEGVPGPQGHFVHCVKHRLRILAKYPILEFAHAHRPTESDIGSSESIRLVRRLSITRIMSRNLQFVHIDETIQTGKCCDVSYRVARGVPDAMRAVSTRCESASGRSA
jgi:hypothetical protein